jgi:hypothetical protein
VSTTIVGERVQRSEVRDQKSDGGNLNASFLTSDFRPLTSSARVPIWSDDLRAGTPPAWMIELAEQVKLIEPELLRGAMLPTGERGISRPALARAIRCRGRQRGVLAQFWT